MLSIVVAISLLSVLMVSEFSAIALLRWLGWIPRKNARDGAAMRLAAGIFVATRREMPSGCRRSGVGSEDALCALATVARTIGPVRRTAHDGWRASLSGNRRH